MAVFSSRPYSPNAPSNRLNSLFRKYPLLFGGPFVGIIVIASFGLSSFTQTRYDLQAQKVKQLSPEEAKRMEEKRRPVDKREEYFRLSAETTANASEEWEPVRVSRPKGTAEWGLPPERSRS